MPERKGWRVMAVIFVLALALRLGFILTLGSGDLIYDSLYDQYVYIDLGKSLAAGRGLMMSYPVFMADANTPTAIEPPGYPLLLAGTFSLFGVHLLPVRLFQALIGALTCLLVYWIGRRVAGHAAGAVAALVAAVYPPLIMYTRPIMTEVVYAFLVAALVLLILRALDAPRPAGYAALSGLVAGLAFLLRPDVAALVGVLAGGLLLAALIRRDASGLRRAAAGIALGGAVALAVISPWVVRNWRVFGAPLVLPTKGGSTALDQGYLDYMRHTDPEWVASCENLLVCAIPNFDRLSELERDRAALAIAADFTRTHPLVALRSAVARVLANDPLLPREALRPPLGYLGEQTRPQDAYNATSLDDVPLYFTPYEKLRVWAFRALFLAAIPGLILALWRRERAALILFAPILASLLMAFLVNGKERYRLPSDLYLMLLAAYGWSLVAAAIRARRAARAPLLVTGFHG